MANVASDLQELTRQIVMAEIEVQSFREEIEQAKASAKSLEAELLALRVAQLDKLLSAKRARAPFGRISGTLCGTRALEQSSKILQVRSAE